jgi:RimJ/RimL family protein N-acetyltransferase
MIQGKRTRLRPIESTDLGFLRDLFNHRLVATSVVGWDLPVSLYSQERWLEATARDSRNCRFLVEDMQGSPLGMTGLWEIDWHNRTALTGLKLHPDSGQGKGYGSDVVFTIMTYAFYDVGVNKLWATILDFNGASLRVFVDKCHWTVEGALRQEVFRNGHFHDQHRIGVLRAEFDAMAETEEYRARLYPGGATPPSESERRVLVGTGGRPEKT